MTTPDETAGVAEGAKPERLYTRDFLFLFLFEFTLFMVFYMMLPVVPLYILDIGGTEATVGWIIGLGGPIAALGIPIYGWGVDRWSRKGMAFVGLGINVVGALVMGLIKTPWLVLAPALLRRVGSGATGTASRTMVLDLAAPERRGEAMTNFATSHNLAIAVGPSLGIALLASRGFVSVFVAGAVVMAVAGLFLFPLRVPQRPFAALTPPVERSGRLSRALRQFFVPEALAPAAAALLLSAAYLATITFISILGEQRGIANYSLFFTVYAVVVITGRLVTGRLSDKYGRAVVLLPSLALGMLCMVLVATAFSFIVLMVAAVALGLGFGTGYPMLQALTADWTPPEKYGRGMAMLMGAFSFGSAGGAIFVGQVSTWFGFTPAFLGLAVVVGAALAVSIVGFRLHGVPLIKRAPAASAAR